MSDEEDSSSAAHSDFEDSPVRVTRGGALRTTPTRRAASQRKSYKEPSTSEEEEEEESEEDNSEESEEESEEEENEDEDGSEDDDDEDEDDDDNDDEDDAPKKKRAKRAQPKKTSRKKKKTADSDDDEEDDEEDDEKPRKRKRTPAKKKKTPSKAKRTSATKTKEKSKKVAKKKKDTSDGVRVKKAPSKMKQLENAMKSYKWWEAEPLPEGIKWRSLEHNGVQFPPPYTPHNVPFIYNGQEVKLSPAAEEVATYFAACIGSQQLEKESTAKIFTANFFKQFKTFLPEDTIVREFNLCDFSKIRAHLDAERERKKQMTKEEKEARKLEEEKKKLKYAYAVVDGTLMKVANTLIEPPGLFRGRGEHPKMGLLKPRVMPEDITLNIGEMAAVPECPIEGHAWGRIIHNHHTTWLANWKDMSGNNKYVYLSASSHFKGQTDREKYEKARRLKKKIPEIRKNYMRGMESGATAKDRQVATAMWIIDRLALRVGGEKEDDEADTVGTCSLRVEHIKLQDPHMMTLDFLGKDSMRHFQTYDLNDPHLEGSGLLAYKCLKSFVKDKKDSEQIFDAVDPSLLNDHLKKIMPGLTAKVFRTYNASFTLEKELPKVMPVHATLEEKESTYNDANRKVAILCNHQRTVSKAQELGLEKKQAEIVELETQLDELRAMKKLVDKGKDVELKPEEVSEEDKRKFSHLFEKQPTSDNVEKRIAVWEKKLDTLVHKTAEADKNKTVALNTSKINYMDPRISVAWAKRNEFPIEKIYSATQRDKFPWAMSEKDNFEF